MQRISLKNPASCRRLLNRTINDLLNDGMETDRARCIGYLTSIILKAIETEDLSKRIDKLEDSLKAEGRL